MAQAGLKSQPGKGGGAPQVWSLGSGRPLSCFAVQLRQTNVKLKRSKTEAGKLDPLLILVTWVTFVTHISYDPAKSYCPQNSACGGGRLRGGNTDRGVGARVGGQMTFPWPPENLAGKDCPAGKKQGTVGAPRTFVPRGCEENTSGHFGSWLPPWQQAYCVPGHGAL